MVNPLQKFVPALWWNYDLAATNSNPYKRKCKNIWKMVQDWAGSRVEIYRQGREKSWKDLANQLENAFATVEISLNDI